MPAPTFSALAVALSLVTPAALDFTDPSVEIDVPPQQMTWIDKADKAAAAGNEVVRCVVEVIRHDERFNARNAERGLSVLITDAMKLCADYARFYVQTYDWLYGSGTGEKSLFGRFRDELQQQVIEKLPRE